MIKRFGVRESIGVNLVGFVSEAVGMGEALRSIARSLKAVNCPFCTYPLQSNKKADTIESFRDSYSESGLYPVTVLVIPVQLLATFLPRIPASFLQDRHLILFTGWELEKAPKEWRGALTFFDEIWTFSQFSKRAISGVCKKDIFVVPLSPDVACKVSKHKSLNKYTFLGIFDYHSNIERKNPLAVIKAFQAAFAKNDHSVQLILKGSNASKKYRTYKVIQSMVKGWRNIKVINKIIPKEKLLQLMRRSDCIVSLHRSEGFGLVCAEGMALGKPVIATKWSGNLDFMNSNNCFLISGKTVRIKKASFPYPKGGRWYDPSIKNASLKMREIYEDRKKGNVIGKSAKIYIKNNLSNKLIGERIKTHVLKLCSQKMQLSKD